MKRLVAALITLGLLTVVFALRRPSSAPVPSQTAAASPEQCIEQMFAAAEQGDVAAYLDCFTGPERDRLARELQDQSSEEFARGLVQTIEALKGLAVYRNSADEKDARQLQLTVERIYAHRTERQFYELVQDVDRWRVNSVRRAEAYQPAKAYGTPVFQPPAAED